MPNSRNWLFLLLIFGRFLFFAPFFSSSLKPFLFLFQSVYSIFLVSFASWMAILLFFFSSFHNRIRLQMILFVKSAIFVASQMKYDESVVKLYEKNRIYFPVRIASFHFIRAKKKESHSHTHTHAIERSIHLVKSMSLIGTVMYLQ